HERRSLMTDDTRLFTPEEMEALDAPVDYEGDRIEENNALVLKHPDEVAPRSPNADLIPALRKVIAMMDDVRAELALAGDKVNLAIGAADVAMLADELLAVKKQAAVDIARIVAAEDGPKFFDVEGLGRVEVHGGTERKKWQSTDVLTEVIFR